MEHNYINFGVLPFEGNAQKYINLGLTFSRCQISHEKFLENGLLINPGVDLRTKMYDVLQVATDSSHLKLQTLRRKTC